MTEGKFPILVDKQKGVDFRFTSADSTLKIGDLSERVIKPAMVQLANQVDADLLALYKNMLELGRHRAHLDLVLDRQRQLVLRLRQGAGAARPLGGADRTCARRCSRRADQWAMLGSQTALYMQEVAKDAYRRGRLGMVGNVDTYSAQNVQAFTSGSRAATGNVMGASQSTTYAATANTATMSLGTRNWTATATIKEGDVFTIANVFAVNPVTKVKQAFLQQFVVRADATTPATTASVTTLDDLAADHHVGGVPDGGLGAGGRSATITMHAASASFNHAQNLVFHKNAFSLVMVPMVAPPGAVDVGRRSYKGYLRSRDPLLRRLQRPFELAPRHPLRRQDRGCAARHAAERQPVSRAGDCRRSVKEIERLIRKVELDKEILAEQGENDEAANRGGLACTQPRSGPFSVPTDCS